MIVAIEGIDGAGKNTLVGAVETALADEGVSVARLGFPAYGLTPFADFADDALHGRLGDVAESAWAMALLFALDRRDRREAIAAAAESHDVLMLDRYVASNAAYSWARTGDRAIVDWVREQEFGVHGLPVPDLQVHLGTAVDEAGRWIPPAPATPTSATVACRIARTGRTRTSPRRGGRRRGCAARATPGNL